MIKRWTIEVEVLDDLTTKIRRRNEGFGSYELLGLIEACKHDILKQIDGIIKPETIREVVIPKDTYALATRKNKK